MASTYSHPSDKAEGQNALWILAGMSIVGLLGLIALLLMSDFPVFS